MTIINPQVGFVNLCYTETQIRRDSVFVYWLSLFVHTPHFRLLLLFMDMQFFSFVMYFYREYTNLVSFHLIIILVSLLINVMGFEVSWCVYIFQRSTQLILVKT